MASRAAIVTGASGGIGHALARMLGEEGHAVTLVARRPEPLQAAAQELAGEGLEVQAVPANLSSEEEIQRTVAAHRDRHGRLDVMVNNAGIGVGSPLGEINTKRLDLQLDVNVRAMVLYYRECLEMLQAAADEHGNALVINTSSIAGKRGHGWLSVYSAAKHAVVGFTEAMNDELAAGGIKSCALCPGFVDTAMTDFIKGEVAPGEMIRPGDIAEMARPLLRLSRYCIVPELIFERPGAGL